jgi:hypothetical protein
MVARASIFFSILGAIALVFACDFLFWHNLAVGFEGMRTYSGISFFSGLLFSVSSFVLAIIWTRRHGLMAPHLVLLSWAIILLLACGAIWFNAP